jgi:hypothetical protein
VSRRNRRNGSKIFKRDVATLSDRAVTTGLVYGYLDNVSYKDVDGLRRAYVNVDKDSVKVSAPSTENIEELYSKKATLVANSKAPTALITRYSPKDPQFNKLEQFGGSLVRAALRKIVDEV